MRFGRLLIVWVAWIVSLGLSGCGSPNGLIPPFNSSPLTQLIPAPLYFGDAGILAQRDLALMISFVQLGSQSSDDQIADRASQLQTLPGSISPPFSPPLVLANVDFASPSGVVDNSDIALLLAAMQSGNTASREGLAQLATQLQGLPEGTFTSEMILQIPGVSVSPAPSPSPELPLLILAGGQFGPSSNQELRVPATINANPAGDGVGAFRIACHFSHAAFDDPVVYPGQPGASHLHFFFGNTGVNAFSTAESIANSGASTCPGGILNRSGYWMPAMFDASGRGLIPTANFYYKRGYGGVPSESIIHPPIGLTIIAGNGMSTTPENAPQAWESHIKWDCDVNGIHGPQGSTIPPCAQGNRVWFSIQFPQCWDGVNLDSADHRSHMAYPLNGCPANYPVAIPEITLTGSYVVVTLEGTEGWHLSSDMYPISATNRGGASNHADWVNGWVSEITETFTQRCLNQAMDCHNELLGEGTMLVRL